MALQESGEAIPEAEQPPPSSTGRAAAVTSPPSQKADDQSYARRAEPTSSTWRDVIPPGRSADRRDSWASRARSGYGHDTAREREREYERMREEREKEELTADLTRLTQRASFQDVRR
eukprot:jgi/Chrzof1/4945/Cz15g05160.t1